MRIRVFYISLAIWYRYILCVQDCVVLCVEVVFCSLLHWCSVLCVFCILFCIDIYVCKCIIVHLCILYLCSVYCVLCMCACVCIVCVYCVRIVYVCVRYRLRFQLNPIPPMLVTYAGIW